MSRKELLRTLQMGAGVAIVGGLLWSVMVSAAMAWTGGLQDPAVTLTVTRNVGPRGDIISQSKWQFATYQDLYQAVDDGIVQGEQ